MDFRRIPMIREVGPGSAMTERTWGAVIFFLSCAVLFITVWCLSAGITIIFMHLYYIPIILLAYHYRKKGFYLSVLLSLLYFALVAAYSPDDLLIIEGAGIRSLVFIGVAALVAFLSDRLVLAQEALRRTANIQEGIIQNANVWLMVLDSAGRILEWNTAAEEMSGFNADEVMGKNEVWKQLYPDRNYRKEITGKITEIIQQERYPENLKTVITCKDGTKKTILWNTRVLPHDGNGNLQYIAIGVDFTATEHAKKELQDANRRLIEHEEELKNSDVRMRAMLESIIAGVVIIDPETHTIIDANAVAAKMIGTEKETLIGSVCNKYICPAEVGACPITDLKQVVDHSENLLIHADGTTSPILKSAVPIRLNNRTYLLESFIDISDIKKAEHALKGSEEKFRIIADYTYDWEYWITPEGTYVYMSPSCEAITGYSPSEFYKKPLLFDEIIYPGDRVAYHDHMELSRISTHPESVEYRIVRKDGDVRWISHICQPMYGRNGELLGRRSSNRDITDRRKAEDALRESEDKYRAFFVTSMDCVFITTLDGKWVDFNDATVDLLGYNDRNELKNIAIRDLYAHPADRDAHIRYIREHGNSREYPVDLQKKDGTIINTLITSIVRKDPSGNNISFQGTIRDVTERRRAEEEIRRSVAQFRTVMDSIDAFVYVSDMKTYELLFLNKYGKDIWGEIEGKTCWQTIQSDQKGPCPFCTNDRLVDGNGNPTGIYNWEFRNTVNGRWYDCRDSAIRWLDGRLVRIEIATDITERKQIEEALHESEQKFRDLFENSRDGIVLADNITHNLVDSNEMFSRLLGYTPEEIKNLAVNDLHPEDSLPDVFAAFEKMLRKGSMVSESLPVKRKDGTIFYADISAYPIIIANTRYIVGVFRDITERRQAEELRQHFTEELELQVKSRTQELEASLDEKVVLLREVHHRVRNNLQIIISLVNLQMRKLEDPQLKQVMAETLNRVRAMSLVHEKLYETESFSQIDFADYIRFLATQLNSRTEMDSQRIRIEFALEKIMVDINTAVPLGLIMNELISNALRHAFPSGKEGMISISSSDLDDLITLSVQDNGIGMPKEFDQENPASLGMNLIMTLIEQIDGTITLDREKGTTFTLTIRRSPANGGEK